MHMLGQALDLALSRGLEASDRVGQAPTPSVLTDALLTDPDLRSVMLELFGTDVSLPSRTRWSAYLDTVDAMVFAEEPATRLESAKIARERFGFRLLRGLASDELRTVCELVAVAMPVIVKEPLFTEPRPEFPDDLLAAILERRNARAMRMWHFLAAPLEHPDPQLH